MLREDWELDQLGLGFTPSQKPLKFKNLEVIEGHNQTTILVQMGSPKQEEEGFLRRSPPKEAKLT
jgi:hypothetical protein